MKSIMKIALGIFFGFVLLIGGCTAIVGGAVSSDSDTDTKTYAEKKADERKELPKAGPSSEGPDASSDEPTPTPKPTKAAPVLSVAQENALASAEDYLSYSAFSHSGLIGQLKYEGFSVADATYAVNHIKVNWNEQAAASAKDYLSYSSFSRQGLIDQLVYEGFTVEQATYGVNQTGL